MKKNNKGFMLVEVIVTSTIVVTAMIALYASFNKLYNNYRVRNSYYYLDGVYATKAMIDSMLQSDDNNFNKFINDVFSNDNNKYIINATDGCNVDGDEGFFKNDSSCNTIKNLYNIENMILVEYDAEILTELKNSDDMSNQTFKDYIDYLITYYDIKKTKDSYSYIILTEIKEQDNYYYSNLRMR